MVNYLFVYSRISLLWPGLVGTSAEIPFLLEICFVVFGEGSMAPFWSIWIRRMHEVL